MTTRTIIRQSITLPAEAAELFEMYLDPSLHEAITGAKVVVSREPGSAFSAFGGALSGHTLAVIPHSLIVQSWRSVAFSRANPTPRCWISERPSTGRQACGC